MPLGQSRYALALMAKVPTHLWFITTFGLGHMRPASGTWGSMPPVALTAALVYLHAGPSEQPFAWYGILFAIALVFSAACLVSGNAAERHYREKDPSQVVADETAGMAVTLAFLPASALATTTRAAVWLGIAFVLFRLADIIKPPPARGLQRLHAGAGILIDDLIAGAYAGGLTLVLSYLLL